MIINNNKIIKSTIYMKKNFQKGCFHKLRKCGCRMTQPRQIIINYLSQYKEHLNVEEIYFELHKKYKNIGLTTIYRTLELLVKNGILNKFDIGDGRARYELSCEYPSKEHHHHLICIKCGKIINYSDFINDEIKLVNKIESKLSKKHNFKILNHIIQFQGLCEKCLKYQ